MSDLFKLNGKDFLHSLIWAVFFAIIGLLETSMASGTFVLTITWHSLLYAVLGAAINVVKRYFTNSDGSIKPEPPK